MEGTKKITASERAYTLIKNRILSGEYEPHRMLNEVTLSQEIGVSRTPVRKALGSLEYELLVTTHPKRGTEVNPVNMSLVTDVFQVRKICEPFIILHYGVMIDREQLLEMRQMQKNIEKEQAQMTAYCEANEDLHRLILDANPNRYLTEMLTKVNDQSQRVRIFTGKRSRQRLLDSTREHLAIIDALICDDYEAAAERMNEHLNTSWRAAIDLLQAGPV